jgi:hypothetical protein
MINAISMSQTKYKTMNNDSAKSCKKFLEYIENHYDKDMKIFDK